MSSKRRLRRRMCVRKVAIIGPQAAHRVAREMRARGKDVHAYPCPFGHHWHVGRPAAGRVSRG
jgi:hypothetical protein